MKTEVTIIAPEVFAKNISDVKRKRIEVKDDRSEATLTLFAGQPKKNESRVEVTGTPAELRNVAKFIIDALKQPRPGKKAKLWR